MSVASAPCPRTGAAAAAAARSMDTAGSRTAPAARRTVAARPAAAARPAVAARPERLAATGSPGSPEAARRSSRGSRAAAGSSPGRARSTARRAPRVARPAHRAVARGSCESSQKNMRSWLYRGVQRSRRLRALSPEPVFLTNSGLRRLPDRPRVLGGKPVFIRVDVRALIRGKGEGTAPTTASRARYFWLAQTAPP